MVSYHLVWLLRRKEEYDLVYMTRALRSLKYCFNASFKNLLHPQFLSGTSGATLVACMEERTKKPTHVNV